MIYLKQSFIVERQYVIVQFNIPKAYQYRGMSSSNEGLKTKGRSETCDSAIPFA